MTDHRWVVLATQRGVFDNIDRDPGEVFELLDIGEDGSYPVQVRLIPRRDDRNRIIPDEFDEEVVLGPDGAPLHRDFCPDTGDQLLTSGPFKGETMRLGWMIRVKSDTPVGIYRDVPIAEFTPYWPPTVAPVKRHTPAKPVTQAPIRGARSRPVRESLP